MEYALGPAYSWGRGSSVASSSGRPAGKPTVGPFRIPRDVRIAERERALGGVPRHPAIRQAIYNQSSGAIAICRLFQALREIASHSRREFAISGVGQPDAPWNIGTRLVAPKRSFGQIPRPWRPRQHIDKGG